MIPVQVKVDGFMCYRDEATLSFDGAALWMLCGRNGSGKSTIFDAMKFALFGTHRDGTQGAEALIHHDKSSLKVEFDFELDPDVYRVVRTLSRGGKPSFQVLHLQGPNAPRSGMPAPQAVPETDSKIGLGRWVEAHIGLNEETFSAAVLLQQGKSDALLNANNETRHNMLTQIVDLAVYQRLHQRTEEQRKKAAGEAATLEKQLAATPPVDAAELASLVAQMETLGGALQQARQELEGVLQLKLQARQWNDHLAAKATLEAQLAHTQSLLTRAPVIERDAARLGELAAVLPQVERFRHDQGRLEQSVMRGGEFLKVAAREHDHATHALQEQESLAATLASAQQQQRHWESVRHEAGETRVRLAPALQEIGELERLRADLAKLDQHLATYAPSLDAEMEGAKAVIARLSVMQAAIPSLGHFATARTAWHAAGSVWATTSAELRQLQEDGERADLEYGQAVEQHKRAATAEQAARRAETRAEALLHQAQAQLQRFEQVEGEPNCSYCGQPLTPEHREREHQRVSNELEHAEHRQEAQQQSRDAESARQAAAKTEQQGAEQVAALREAGRLAQETKREAARNQEGSLRQALEALGELPPLYAQRIRDEAAAAEAETAAKAGRRRIDASDAAVDAAPDSTTPVPPELQGQYPTVAEMTALRQEVRQLAAQEAGLQKLQNLIAQRNTARAQREPGLKRCAELADIYADEQVTALRAEERAAVDQAAQAGRELTVLTATLRDTGARLQAVKTRLTQSRQAENEAGQGVAAEAAAQREITQALEQLQRALPVAWQTACAALTEATLADWQAERRQLEGDRVWEKLQELQTARRQLESYQERLQHLQAEMDKVPDGARRPLQLELDAAENLLRGRIVDGEEALMTTTRDQDLLEARLERGRTLEAELVRASRDARLYDLLDKALGRDGLQRHLLQAAEGTIVEAANAVLDRISGGTLRLELRRGEDGEVVVAGGRRGTPKALDLVAYNSQTGNGQTPLPVAFLSGSQRFRVAVSLALGIGHYATQGAHRVEAVIIDEGFGSLDKEGRGEMIEELHNLQNVLKRVILVSHQEEFSESFSNRYLIELQNGTSRASLQELV